MAKGKPGANVQNRAIYSRISFLQQAAFTLTSINDANPPAIPSQSPAPGSSSNSKPVLALEGMSRRLASDLRSISLKTRIRLNPAVKRVICKFCDSVLIDGDTCTSTIENKSKGAKKPWADVLVRTCRTCGRERRYPVSAGRPKRKTEREVVGPPHQ